MSTAYARIEAFVPLTKVTGVCDAITEGGGQFRLEQSFELRGTEFIEVFVTGKAFEAVAAPPLIP